MAWWLCCAWILTWVKYSYQQPGYGPPPGEYGYPQQGYPPQGYPQQGYGAPPGGVCSPSEDRK